MFVTLRTINPSDPISSAPEILNGNFEEIKSALDKVGTTINPDTLKIILNTLADPGNGGIAASAMILLAASGKVLRVQPGGGATTYSLDSDGTVTATKLTITGDSDSTIRRLLVQEIAGFAGETRFAGIVDFATGNAKIKSLVTNLALSTGNIGSSATTPIDLSISGETIFLDASNGGTALSGSGVAAVNLALSTMEIGQRVKILVSSINSNDIIAMENGVNGDEKFALMSINGINSLDSTTLPTHDNTTIGSYLDCIYMQISPSTNRLVIIESKGFNF